jgi:acyl-homoserine lactone acylase PvdQ
MPRSVSAVALAAALILALPTAASADDFAGTALNVVPSGQWGSAPVPPGADSQAKLYDSLTPRFDQVNADDLTRSFKSERFGVGPDGPATEESVPRKGVRILRDRYNVPHIDGSTRDDVTWAMGWVLQEDRGLLLAQGRYPARLAAIDAPNIDAFSLVTGLKTYTPTPEVDRTILRNGLEALRSQGQDGKRLLHDVDVFIAGINARLRAEGSTAKRFTRVDMFAVNALVGQIFGEGGGGEAQRSELLGGLRKRLGKRAGNTLFDDLSEHRDSDSPATISKTFDYGKVPKKTPGAVVLDPGSLKSFKAVASGAVAARATQPRWASNFLIVGRQQSATGHPLFVAGPQIGYFYPGLTLEADISWPGGQARGVYTPGSPGSILIGRGQDFAWSLTSAGSDLVDEYAEVLCGGSKTRYEYKGKCRKMGSVDAGTIKGEGRVKFRTTVHGPVTGYAKWGKQRVAIARKRASFGRDILFELPFRDATVGHISGTSSFKRAFARSPFTFNVGYADDRDIAMFSAGRLPKRAKGVDSRLLTLGTGKYEWTGFLKADKHPQAVDPSSGQLVNWNNVPARGWAAADNNWSYGSLHRVSLLRGQLARHPTQDLASVTASMNAAATQDLRSVALTPTLSRLLHGGPAPSARAEAMLALLEAWNAGGSSRLDVDEDGNMDAGAAPAIWDELYPRLLDTVMGPRLGAQLDELKALEGDDNSTGSGFTGGGINYIDKDLKTLLGTKFKQPFHTSFCGKGDLASCRTAVWAALDAAGTAIAARQGVEAPGLWKSDANAERIKFAPGLLTTTIRYTNRPSGIQQVISFTGHRSKRD